MLSWESRIPRCAVTIYPVTAQAGSLFFRAAPAQGAPYILEGQKARGGDEHTQSCRQAEALVADGEVHVRVAGGGIKQQRQDGHEGDQEKGDEPCRDRDHQRLKPAQIAERDAEQRSFAAGAIKMMGRGHLQ